MLVLLVNNLLGKSFLRKKDKVPVIQIIEKNFFSHVNQELTFLKTFMSISSALVVIPDNIFDINCNLVFSS
jgi:hypothetical protein